MAAKKNPDGSLTWGSVENQTPFQTLAVPEPPPVVNTPLVLGSITCTATTFTV